MSPSSLRIETLAGYAPAIGRLVAMLRYARETTLAAVNAISMTDLDHLHDDTSNSIGALLAHAAAVEQVYQCLTFDERQPTAAEQQAWSAALTLGAEGRRLLRGQPLAHYVDELEAARQRTLIDLAAHDDDWLERPMRVHPAMNAHWAWFHVAEDEINHRGQIRWLRARLPGATSNTGHMRSS